MVGPVGSVMLSFLGNNGKTDQVLARWGGEQKGGVNCVMPSGSLWREWNDFLFFSFCFILGSFNPEVVWTCPGDQTYYHCHIQWRLLWLVRSGTKSNLFFTGRAWHELWVRVRYQPRYLSPSVAHKGAVCDLLYMIHADYPAGMSTSLNPPFSSFAVWPSVESHSLGQGIAELILNHCQFGSGCVLMSLVFEGGELEKGFKRKGE